MMRYSILVVCMAALTTVAGEKQSRYKVGLNLRIYPQTDAKQALASTVKAIGDNDYDYFMAQLADPEYVDAKVEIYKEDFEGPVNARRIVAFEKLVKEIKKHFREDPSLARELRELAKKGKWEFTKEAAFVFLPAAAERGAFFRQVNGRWYLMNKRNVK